MAVLILTTVPDDDLGDVIARALVDERLAACVNIGAAMTSVYRWKGSIERDVERQLVIKTTRDRVPAVEARLAELHPYELPEFLVIPIGDGGGAYLAWVAEQTSVNS
jgi:periplasmic divalent cation tolerance protein